MLAVLVVEVVVHGEQQPARAHRGEQRPHSGLAGGRLEAASGCSEKFAGGVENRAVATAMVHGPAAGLDMLDRVAAQLEGHHRLHAVRGHLLERAGHVAAAAVELRLAAAKATNIRAQQHLFAEAARMACLAAPDLS